MEAVRYIEEVDSSTLTLDNLEQFKGQKVEIIIMPYESQNYKYDEEWAIESENRLKAFKQGDIKAVDGEKTIAELKEKYSAK